MSFVSSKPIDGESIAEIKFDALGNKVIVGNSNFIAWIDDVTFCLNNLTTTDSDGGKLASLESVVRSFISNKDTSEPQRIAARIALRI